MSGRGVIVLEKSGDGVISVESISQALLERLKNVGAATAIVDKDTTSDEMLSVSPIVIQIADKQWKIEVLMAKKDAKSLYDAIYKDPLSIINQKGVTLFQDSGISKDGYVYKYDVKIDNRLNKIFNVRTVDQACKSIQDKLQKNDIKQWIGASSIRELIVMWEDRTKTSAVFSSQLRQQTHDINGASDADIRGWIFQSEKIGGASSAGEHGGVYKRNDEVALIKQDESVAHNISEFLASRIFKETAPGYGAEIFLTKFASAGIEGSEHDEIGDQVYIGSKFFRNYKDLYVDAYDSLSKPVPSDRPRNVGTWNRAIFKEALSRDGYKHYQDFSHVMVTSLLMGDFDVHWGNVGVIQEESRKKLVRIDFGWAFKNLTPDLRPRSTAMHLPGLGPTNHFREYPETMIFNSDFIDELRRVSDINLTYAMQSAFDELKAYYGSISLKQFAYSIDVPRKVIKETEKEEGLLVQAIQNHLKMILGARQQSMKDFATEIEIDLCFRETPEGVRAFKGYYDEKRNFISFKDIMCKNPEYFQQISEGQRHIHLRSKEFKGSNKWWGNLDIFRIIGRIYKGYLEKVATSGVLDAFREHSSDFAKWEVGSDVVQVSRGYGALKKEQEEQGQAVISESDDVVHSNGNISRVEKSVEQRAGETIREKVQLPSSTSEKELEGMAEVNVRDMISHWSKIGERQSLKPQPKSKISKRSEDKGQRNQVLERN